MDLFGLMPLQAFRPSPASGAMDTLHRITLSWDAGELEWGTTYYWRVDEVGENETWKGTVWSFATADYLLVDSTGKKATVANATGVNTTAWTEVEFPLTGFGGVSLTKVTKLIVGVGDPANPAADGTGRIFIDDIRITRP